jgi:hypothetical protein
MEITIITLQGITMAEVSSGKIEITNVDTALDLIGNCSYQGADMILLGEENITPAFFDLKTGLAGEILQKFSTYHMKLAIVGDFSKYSSKSLGDFIRESNRMGRIRFVDSIEEAKAGFTNPGV